MTDRTSTQFRQLRPTLEAGGVRVEVSVETRFEWQDPADASVGGRVQLSPLGDFVGAILFSANRQPDLREQDETCNELIARMARYYKRPFEPNPCKNEP